MAAVTFGNSAGAPRCRPPVQPTPSNQKNGPTPALCAQESMAACTSGTTQHTCMNFLLGNARAIVTGQPINGKRSPFSGAHGVMSLLSKFGHGDPFQQMSAGWVTSR